jgi:hypothetical protein
MLGGWGRFHYAAFGDSALFELSGALPCPAFLLQQLLFQRGDADMCGVQLASQELGIFECAGGLRGKGLESGDSLTELIDFHGPAGLMCLLAVFGELGAPAEGTQLVLELLLFDELGRCGLGASFG